MHTTRGKYYAQTWCVFLEMRFMTWIQNWLCERIAALNMKQWSNSYTQSARKYDASTSRMSILIVSNTHPDTENSRVSHRRGKKRTKISTHTIIMGRAVKMHFRNISLWLSFAILITLEIWVSLLILLFDLTLTSPISTKSYFVCPNICKMA